MSDQHRNILNHHWKMLTTYINPTDDLVKALVEERVIPPSMANDIKTGKTRMEKNEKMLKSLILRGNSSFRKFRQVILQYEQLFIAELLFDEESEKTSFIEAFDFDGYPSFKTSLNPLEQKQLIMTLDSKIKARLLKSEWRNNSEERLKRIEVKMRADKNDPEEMNKTIDKMKTEITMRNDTLRSVIKDYNTLNDDVTHFTKRHEVSTRLLMTKSLERGDSYSTSNNALEWIDVQNIPKTRFKFVDSVVREIDQRISTLLGDGQRGLHGVKDFVSLLDLNEKTKRLEELVRELEASVDTHKIGQLKIQGLLFPDEQDDNNSSTVLQTVQRFLSQQQNKRNSLLMDIDTLSKKLRGLPREDTNAHSKSYRLSAVIGKPRPEIVDYSFLRNHVALLNADADHIHKKIHWKDQETNALRSELLCLRKRVKVASSSKRNKLSPLNP